MCGGSRALQFCARIFELYMGDLFDPVNIGVVQRLFDGRRAETPRLALT